MYKLTVKPIGIDAQPTVAFVKTYAKALMMLAKVMWYAQETYGQLGTLYSTDNHDQDYTIYYKKDDKDINILNVSLEEAETDEGKTDISSMSLSR